MNPNCWRTYCVAVLASCLALPAGVALALSAQSGPETAGMATTSAKASVCFTEVFSGPLPGKSDYCLGMRDWNDGHYRSGLAFFKRAAGWGNKNAQYTLGLIYYAGHHVPADTALGLAWLKLADERHNDDTIDRARRSALQWATPGQRETAEQLYRTMADTYGDKVAANRAWQRLQNWRRSNGSESGCIRLSGAQAGAAQRLGLAGVPPQSIQNMLVSSEPISIPVTTASSKTNGGGLMKKAREARKRQRNFAINRAGVCVTLHTQQEATQQLAAKYFDGWMGTVNVGPLQQVPAPASSSTH